MRYKITRKALILVLLTCLCILPACSGNQAEELFKTAQFEELQNNREHAKQLYMNIVKNHPSSDYAKKAESRLSEIAVIERNSAK